MEEVWFLLGWDGDTALRNIDRRRAYEYRSSRGSKESYCRIR